MSYRDNFSSDMKSPGGWGGSGSAGGGFGGGKSSGSVYEYRNMPNARPNTRAIGNWNTGGGSFGFGTPDAAKEALSNMYRPQPQVQAPVQSGPIPPALGPQGIPASYIPGATQPPAQRPPMSTYPGPGPAQFFDLTNYQDPWSAAYGNQPRSRAMGAGPQGTSNWRNSTAVQQTGGVTKDQSRVPQNNATYARMGNDFRSIASW